jgi:hypothetical protein
VRPAHSPNCSTRPFSVTVGKAVCVPIGSGADYCCKSCLDSVMLRALTHRLLYTEDLLGIDLQEESIKLFLRWDYFLKVRRRMALPFTTVSEAKLSKLGISNRTSANRRKPSKNTEIPKIFYRGLHRDNIGRREVCEFFTQNQML